MSAAIETVPERFTCPDWCAEGVAGHQQALDEGCSWEDARVHRSADLACVLPDLTNAHTGAVLRDVQMGWQVVALADPFNGWWAGPSSSSSCTSSARAGSSSDWRRTSPAARRARLPQLLRLADHIDL